MAASQPAQGADYWAAAEECLVCQRGDFAAGYGPRTMVTCEACLDKGTHVECWHAHSGEMLTEERLASPSFQWFCCEGCRLVSDHLVKLTGVTQPLRDPGPGGAVGEYSVELVRWSELDKGCQKTVGHAKAIFNSAFSPLVMENGRNLIDMVCEAYESPEQEQQQEQQQQEQEQQAGRGTGQAGGAEGEGEGEGEGEEEQTPIPEFNFSTFRVLLLRKRGIVVSAATVRAFGTLFGEVPFVATREGYRREGHCRRLMQELEGLLRGMGVRYIIVPAMRVVLPMWLKKFGYCQFSHEECAVLEERIVMPDPSSATLVHKLLDAPASAAAAARGGARKGQATEQGKKSRSVRFGVVTYAESSSDEEEEPGGGGGRGGRRGAKGGKRRRLAAKDDADAAFDYEVSEEEEENEEEADDELCDTEEWECHRCRRRSDTCIASAATGAMVCDACIQQGDLCEHADTDCAPPAVAAAPTALASSSNGPGAAAGKRLCSTCGADGASKRRKTGLTECGACSRYRQQHEGQPRPESLWARDKPRRQPAKPRATSGSGPVPRTATKPSAQGSRPAAAGQAAASSRPQQLRRDREQAREWRVLRCGLRLFSGGKQAARQAAGRNGGGGGSGSIQAAAGRLLLEQLTADHLAGHVLGVVQAADEQHAQQLLAYEERALRDQEAAAAQQARLQAAEQAAAASAAVSAEQEAFIAALASHLPDLDPAAAQNDEAAAASPSTLLQDRQAAAAAEAAEQELAGAVEEQEQAVKAQAAVAADQAAAAARERQLLAEISRLKEQLRLHQEVQQAQAHAQAQAQAHGVAAAEGQHGHGESLLLEVGGDAAAPADTEMEEAVQADRVGLPPALPSMAHAAAASAGGRLAPCSAAGGSEAVPPRVPPPPPATSKHTTPTPPPAAPALPVAAVGSDSMQQLLAGRLGAGNSAAACRTDQSAPSHPSCPADNPDPHLAAIPASRLLAGSSYEQQLQGGGPGGFRHRPVHNLPPPTDGARESAAGSGSEDLFGLFGGLGGGASCGASAGGKGSDRDSPTSRGGPAEGRTGPVRNPASLPASPGTSLDRVLGAVAADGAAGTAHAAAAACRPNLAATLRMALGSQESCSQGGVTRQLHSTQPDTAPAAVAQLAALSLLGKPQTVTYCEAPGSAGAAWPGCLAANAAAAAMLDVEDIAQYLAD